LHPFEAFRENMYQEDSPTFMRTYHTRTRGSTGWDPCADEGLHRDHNEQLE